MTRQILKALDGNIVEEGAKFFLRNGWLVNIVSVQYNGTGSVRVGWQGAGGGRNAKTNDYTYDGEKVRSDYEEEHIHDILSLHSYKSNSFSKAIRSLEAKGQTLQAS